MPTSTDRASGPCVPRITEKNLALPARASAEKTILSMPPSEQTPSPRTVLIVDDSPDLVRVLASWLERRSDRVLCAHSGKEAAAILRHNHVDVVVTDVLMPDGDGIELITSMRQSEKRPRLVAMSGGGRFMNAPNCLDLAHAAGANVCLQKPFTHLELFAAIDGHAA